MDRSRIDELKQRCARGDSSQKVAAIHELVELEAYEAVPTLVDLLADADAVIRFATVRALGTLGANDLDRVGPALMRLLADAEVTVRSEAADVLGLLGYRSAVGSLRSMLASDPEPLVRASAAESLGDLSDESARTELEAALRDDDESVRAYAAGALGMLDAPQLVQIIQARARTEPSPRVKAELYGAAYRLGAEDNLKGLLELLDSADESLAIAILNLLEDLARHKQPPMLAADAPRILGALDRVATRLGSLHPEVDKVRECLGSIT